MRKCTEAIHAEYVRVYSYTSPHLTTLLFDIAKSPLATVITVRKINKDHGTRVHSKRTYQRSAHRPSFNSEAEVHLIAHDKVYFPTTTKNPCHESSIESWNSSMSRCPGIGTVTPLVCGSPLFWSVWIGKYPSLSHSSLSQPSWSCPYLAQEPQHVSRSIPKPSQPQLHRNLKRHNGPPLSHHPPSHPPHPPNQPIPLKYR